jgi:nitrite reductase/ring-hydroxylating ferredoxin subunit
MPFFKVCPVCEVSSEKPKKFTVNDHNILIAKSNSHQIFAFDATCSHADKSLEKGTWNPETTEITCPFHKAIFSIAENGAVKAPPAFVPLPVYKVEIKDEYVFVFLE